MAASPVHEDAARLHRAMEAVWRSSASEQEAALRWLTLACQSLRAQHVALYAPRAVTARSGAEPLAADAGEEPPLQVIGSVGQQAAISDELKRPLGALASKSQADDAVQFARIGADLKRLAVAVPVARADGVRETLVAVFDGGTREATDLARIAREGQLLAGFAGVWRGRWSALVAASEKQLPATSGTAAAHDDGLLAALVATAQAQSLEEVAVWWCRFAAERSLASQVAIGRPRIGGACRLLAVAPERPFNSNSPLVNSIEAVMAEAVLRADEPVGGRPDRRATQAMQQLRELSGATQIRSLLLRDAAQQVRGVCLLWGDHPWSDEAWRRCESWGRQAGLHLGLAQAARGWFPAQLTRRWQALSARQRWRIACVASTLVAALCAVPVPSRIACRGDLQPAERRLVVAPQEGKLEQALVRPGDQVQAGQLLARLDDRDLRLELASLEADRGRAAKERDRALATRDTATSQLAALELQRLELKRQLIESRLERLEIRSPIAGQVIGGDLHPWEGSRLSQGQTLVEVAPPGTLVLELLIPDVDIDRAVVGKAVRCRLDSTPQVSLAGTLRSIRPRAEVRDGENVFVGLVDLQLPSDATLRELRPGMRARARLEAEPRSLAWQVLHRAWEQVRFRWGW